MFDPVKRLLLIGDPDSLWVQRYVENVLHPAGWQTVIYPIYGWKGGHREAYARTNATVDAGGRSLPVLGRIPKVRMWAGILANAAALTKLGPFDAVHCHYLSVTDLALGCVMAKRMRIPLAATFWGSDLLRAEPGTLARMKKYLARCSVLTVFNPEHVERIRTLYGDAMAQKTRVLDFGEGVFPHIDRVLAEGGREAAMKLMNSLKLAQIVVHVADVRTCVLHPASMTHRQLSEAEQIAAGVSPDLIRVSVGIEHIDDIIADFDQALNKVGK